MVFSSTSPRLMANLRRTCPPGTRIVRRSNPNSTNTSPTQSKRTSPSHSFSTGRVSWAYKNDQDRDSLKPGSQEYSKSGGDDAAAHSSKAFDGSSTRPESEQSGDATGSLKVSPANSEVSKGTESKAKTERAPDSGDRKRTSGAGSGQKNG